MSYRLVILIFQDIHCPVWHGLRSTKKSIAWWILRTKVMAMLPLTRFSSKPWRDLILDRLLHVWHPIIMPRNPLPQTSPSIWDVSSIFFLLFRLCGRDVQPNQVTYTRVHRWYWAVRMCTHSAHPRTHFIGNTVPLFLYLFIFSPFLPFMWTRR